jgi:DNA-binding LacI/PurR family transcriptional regulator
MDHDEAEKLIRKPKAITSLKELSEHLNLSPTTVSRVVNRSRGSMRIPAQTRDRVLAAAAKFNYQPNALARSLRSKHSQIVSVIVPEISDGYSASVLSGIEDGLLLGGYFYFVVSHRHRPELLREYPALLISRAVEGIIAVDSTLEDDLPVPLVSISSHNKLSSAVNIELDHSLAAHYALEHLKRLGHTRIAIIKGQSFSSDTQVRWRAICKVAAEIGVEIHPRLTVQLEETGLGAEPGRVATRKLIERGEKFSAIFAFNDHTAMGAITALREAGITVPGQVSVVGFDDIPGAAIHNPPLTTVRQPLHEMGRVAATELLEMLRGGMQSETPRTIHILPTFIERQSTAVAEQVRKRMQPVVLRQSHS